MKTKLILRIATLVILVHILGHIRGHAGWKTPKDPGQQEVVNQMLTNKAPFMGAVRSMGDYFEGYGQILTVVLVMMMAMTWIISGHAAQHPKIASTILAPLAGCFIAISVIEFIYFFAFAASISLVAGVLIGVASWQLANVKI